MSGAPHLVRVHTEAAGCVKGQILESHWFMGGIVGTQRCVGCEQLEARVIYLEKRLEEVARDSHNKETKLK